MRSVRRQLTTEQPVGDSALWRAEQVTHQLFDSFTQRRRVILNDVPSLTPRQHPALAFVLRHGHIVITQVVDECNPCNPA